MGTESIEKILGGSARVRTIKLFVFNSNTHFSLAEISKKIGISKDTLRKELSMLKKAGFIRRQTKGYILNPKFPYLDALEAFFSRVNPFGDNTFVQKISRVGKVQLLVVSGFFIKEPASRVDLLVVVDNLRPKVFERTIREMEEEMGREIRYSLFSVNDFLYRRSMFDKLIRDVLDSPHEKVIDKLAL